MSRKKRKVKIDKPKKEVVEIQTPITDLSFSDAEGKKVKLSSVISETDIIPFKVKHKTDDAVHIRTKYMLTYDAVKRIAKIAGITNYTFALINQPSIYNRMTTYLRVTITTPDGHFSKLGEASDENTNDITKRYKGTTAEKRGYVRAVIDYLGLPNLYGEDEINEDQKETEDKAGLTKKEFEELSEVINTIINTKTIDELRAAGEFLKGEITKYSPTQIDYLRRLYGERIKIIEAAGF